MELGGSAWKLRLASECVFVMSVGTVTFIWRAPVRAVDAEISIGDGGVERRDGLIDDDEESCLGGDWFLGVVG